VSQDDSPAVRVERRRSELRVTAESATELVEVIYSGGPERIGLRLHEGPSVRVFSRDELARHPALSAVLRLIADEAESKRAPDQRLLGFLFRTLQVYIHRIATDNPLPRWGRPFRHPQIERALALLNEDVQKRWTVTLLARAVGLSRPVFARLFVEAVGLSPMRYLTEQRMRVAAALLLESDAALAEVARRVGYDSEFAFGRAFKRHHQVPPGGFRRERVAGIEVGAFETLRPRCAA
jgi:AraC-like DNA-binding protein